MLPEPRTIRQIAREIVDVQHPLSLIPDLLDQREAEIRMAPGLTQKQRRPQIAAVRAELREEQEQLFVQLRVLTREMRQIAREKRERDKLVVV